MYACCRYKYVLYHTLPLASSVTITKYYLSYLPPVALSALKRKKRYEKQLQQIDGTLSTIEMQREALEGANTNTAVLQTMGEAAKAMKAAHKHMYVSPRRCGGISGPTCLAAVIQ